MNPSLRWKLLPDEYYIRLVHRNEISLASLPATKPLGEAKQSIDCFTPGTPDGQSYERLPFKVSVKTGIGS
jgi:hypothetical protein